MKWFMIASALAVAAVVNAECPNACSGHGTCQPKDMCACYKNWQGNDCSEATCPFGIAHVDTPKGNLNGDGGVTMVPVLTGSTVYPEGTIEMYPFPGDPLNLAAVDSVDEGHYYMECSNKGLCDRETGLCQCFDGYEGTACKRAACPNKCSGHGTCESIKELGLKQWQLRPAYGGHGRAPYGLWDADATMGCLCDAEFVGADCSQRACKHGVDPLYSTEDVGSLTITAANTDEFTLAFYAHNSTTGVATDTYVVPASFNVGTYTVADCDALIANIGAAENSVGLAPPSVVSGLKCTASSGVFKLTFPKAPGLLSAAFFKEFVGTPKLAYSPTSTCIANPVTEEVLLYVGGAGLAGDYRLKFYDVFGEDYVTEPITATVLTSTTTGPNNHDEVCNGVVSRLRGLPNGVIGDVRCAAFPTTNGALLRLNFYKNPGVLKPMSVYEANLSAGEVKVGTVASGEFVDRFATKMVDGAGADIFIASLANDIVTFAVDISSFGFANGDLVKIRGRHYMVLASTTTTVTLAYPYTGAAVGGVGDKVMMFTSSPGDAGWSTAVPTVTTWNGGDSTFEPSASLVSTLTVGDVLFVEEQYFTVVGVATASPWTVTVDRPIAATAAAAAAILFASNAGAPVWLPATPTITTWDFGSNHFAPSADLSAVLHQGDMLFVHNQYFTVQSALAVAPWTVTVDRPFGGVAFADLSGKTTTTLAASASSFYYLKAANFVASTGTYAYVSECSNRGSCDAATGVCACFKGYSGDNCDTQNALFV